MQSKNLNTPFGDVIVGYSREQALADGVLVDVTVQAAQNGFTIPVATTEAVWEQYIEWSDADSECQTMQNTSGRLSDVLWMLYLAIRSNKSADYVLYKLSVIPRDGKSKRAKTITLKATINGGDNGEPVITIMLPHED